MSTRINVDGIAFTDPRFIRLAQLLALADADHARAKVEWLWLDCTTRGETALPQWLVEQRLGPRGPEALIESELARWSTGRGDTRTRRLYIRGATERALWRETLREQSSKGGKARASGASRTAGRFTSRATSRATSQSTSPLTLALTLAPEELSAGADPPVQKPEAPRPETGHAPTVALFHELYRTAYQAKPQFTAAHGQNLKRLLKSHGAEETQRRMRIMFDAPPNWLKPPFDFGTFVQHFDKFVVEGASSGTGEIRQTKIL